MKKIIYYVLVISCLVNTVSASHVSKEEIARWKKIGVYYSYVSHWKKAGISLEEAVKWITLVNVGSNGLRAGLWKKIGVQTPEEASRWKQAGIRFRDVPMWKKSGLSIDRIAKWKSVGLNGCSFIIKMEKGGISPDEASRWVKIGIDNNDTIIKMKKAGISPKEVIEWNKVGVKVRDINYWKKEGLTAEKVTKWEKISVSIQNISALEKDGLSPEKVLKWRQAGVYAQMIHNLKVEGLTAEEVLEWGKIKVSPFDISGLKKEGLHLEELKAWAKVGVDSNNINYAKKVGLSPEEISKWKSAGISNKHMFEWKKEGITLLDATKWIALRINIPLMHDFKTMGVASPEEAAKWKKAGIFKLKNIDFLKVNNVDPDEITENSIEKNHKMIEFLASSFDKSLWKEVYEKVSDKCQDNKCIGTFFRNTAKVRDDMLLVKVDGSSVLLEFPSKGFFSSFEVPDTFTLINNKGKKFRSILKPSGTNKIELDGEEYKIETYEVVVAPVAKK